MAKKGFIKDLNNIEMLPITRGELVLDSSGKLALRSNKFLATDSLPGLMSKEDKAKLDKLNENGYTIDLVSATTDGLAPKIGTAAASTVTTQADEWVLTSTKGATPTWRKLPTNAFLNYYRPILVNGTSLLGNDNTALNIAAGTNINLTTDAGKVTINNGLTKLSQLTNDSGYLTNNSLNNYVTLNTEQEITGTKTFTKQLKFTVVLGTAPFTVTSTTKVDFLNADYLDGKHLTDILNVRTITSYSDLFDLNSLGDINIDSTTWYYAGSHNVLNQPWDTSAATVWTFPGSYSMQIAKFYNSNEFKIRGRISDGWSSWKQIAFTDSNITGNAATSNKVYINLYTGNDVEYPILWTNANNDLSAHSEVYKSYSNLTYNPVNNRITATSFKGNLTGNASTADKLKTKVKLWGNEFDGSNDVNGSMYFKNNSHLHIADNQNNPTSVLVYNASNLLALGYSSSGKGHKTSVYGSPIDFCTGTDRVGRMIIDNNGNVGIGTITPKCKLSVNPTTLDKNPTLGNLATDGTIGFGDLLYKTYFWTRGNGNGYILVGREDGNTSVYHLILQVLGGNVGIGTNNPLYKLDVNGVILSKGIVIGNELNYSAKSTEGKDISLMYLSSSNNLIIGKGVSDNGASTYVHGNGIIFRSKGGVTDLTMRINSHGNVTIGNSDLAGSTYKLYVNGNTNISGSLTASTFLGNLDWSYITNKPTSFTPAAHSHNELIYIKDLRNESTIPNDYNQTFKFVGIKDTNAIGLASLKAGYVSLIGWRGYTNDGTGPFSWEMASGSDRMYVRSGNTQTWVYNWKTLAYTTDTYPTNQITALTGYTKATSASDLVTTDTLNIALGKLEYKAGIAYSWYRTITEDDTDEIINKWDEVVDFVNNLEVDLTEEFVTRKTDLTITGIKTFQNRNNSASITIESGSILGNVYTWGGWARDIMFSNTDTNATGETTTVSASFGVYGGGYGLQHTGSNQINYLYLAHQDLDYSTAVFKVYKDKATISDKEIYHKGNLKNLSDLNDDVVRGKYLRLTGGIIKNGTSDTPLILNTSRTEGDIGMRFSLNDVSKGWIGYNNSYGTYLYTHTGPHRLGIKDNGVAYCDSYTLLHSGNYTNYINSTNFPGLAGVRSVTVNGNYLRVNTNGTNADLTIPYATLATSLKHTSLTTGLDLNTLTTEGVYSNTQTNVCVSLVNGPANRSNGECRLESITCGSGSYGFQTLYTRNTANYEIWYRTWSGDSFTSWVKNIHSGNYTDYTVKKDGTGATGTWGINITGSAGSVAWGNITGKPTIPTVTDYYWANVKISSTSSTTTTPTFGALTFTTTSGIAFKGSKATDTMIKFLDNTVDSYGNGIVIGGGGVVIIGSGESSSAILSDTTLNVTGGIEITYITSDGDIIFCSGVDTSTGRKSMVFGSGGNLTVPGTVTSNSGFNKTGSSNSYVLLGGGGHKAISDFLLKSEVATQELSANLTTITKSLTVTADWMDTGIAYNNLPANGSYIVLVYVQANDATGAMYSCYWSGVMTWFVTNPNTKTNDTETDEILLHRSGHGYHNTIYLRTVMTTGSDSSLGLKLLIAANKNIGAAYTYTFKFKRII